MSFRELFEARTITVYHGDNYNTKKLDPSLMDNGNNQEGIGIYFGSLETAKVYGKNIVKAEITKSNYVESRQPISKALKLSEVENILLSLYKKSDEILESFYYAVTDWGIEISEPEDVTDDEIEFLASKMLDEDVRDFQVTISRMVGVENFVSAWNKYTKISGTFHKQSNDEVFYAIINPKVKITPVKV